MQSFEATKGDIVSSSLGQAIGLTASSIWSQIVAKIKSVVNRGALNWSGSNTAYSVPAGYYTGGTLDSRPSYNSGYNAGVTAADNRSNPNSTNYKTGYNAGVAAADARVNTGSASYTSGYNAGHNAGITSGRQSIRLTRVHAGTKNSDRTATISVSSGRDYIVSFGGDPGQFQNFSVSGGTVLSKITGGDTPPDGTYFGLMALVRATSNSMTVNLGTGGSVYGFLISRVDYA